MTPGYIFGAPQKAQRWAEVVVHETLITMLLWPSVPVLRQVEHDLTVIDRFIVEAAVALARMQPHDVEEITDVPADAVRRIADRLVVLGLLVAEGDGYTATARAPGALQRKAIPELRPAYLTFLYLPDTDELVAFPPGPQTVNPPLLQRAQPAGATRLPDEMASLRRSDLITERISSSLVPGLRADIVNAIDSQELMPVNCPQYRCRGMARWVDGTAEIVLQIISEEGKQVTAKIIGAQRLADRWLRAAESGAQAGAGWAVEGGKVTATRVSATAWAFELDGVAAAAAESQGVVLGGPAGLMVQDTNDIIYLDATFSPSDRDARWIFAVHHAYREVSGMLPEKVNLAAVQRAAEAASTRFDLPPEAIDAREVIRALWQRELYQHVYSARSEEDFADA